MQYVWEIILLFNHLPATVLSLVIPLEPQRFYKSIYVVVVSPVTMDFVGFFIHNLT